MDSFSLGAPSPFGRALIRAPDHLISVLSEHSSCSQTVKSWQEFSWTRSYEGRAAPLRRNKWMYNVLGVRTSWTSCADAGPDRSLVACSGSQKGGPVGWSSPISPLRFFRTLWKKPCP